MSETISALKAQARNLQAALERASNPSASLAFAQELLAQQYGAPNWNTLVALADRPTSRPAAVATLRLKDLPGMPSILRVEVGNWSSVYTIDEFDEEAIAALDDPDPTEEDEAMVTAIEAHGEEGRLELTVADLKGAKGQVLGGYVYWELADGRFISFLTPPAAMAGPAPAAGLVVPALMARSSRGASVARVRGGLVVLPAQMPAQRFMELLQERLPGPTDDAMLDAVCAQLGAQWLGREALAQSGVELVGQ